MKEKFRSIIIFLIILSLVSFIPIFVMGLSSSVDLGEDLGEGIPSTPITESSYYQQADLEVEDSKDQLDLSSTTETSEKLEGDFNGRIKTKDWEAEGTFSNLVVGNGGIYEAVITGVSAGTTMYFLSTFDDQIFKFTAGSDESAIRVVQFDKDGFMQERVYFELAEGDTIEQGSLFEVQNYHYEAYDDASIYIYNQDQTTEIKLGEQSYTGIYNESFENPTEDYVKTALTENGFYNITLNENSKYTYNLDFLNLTLNNNNNRKITICKNSEDVCEVYNTGNTFVINGADKSLMQDGFTILESLDENNIIELNFAEQTMTLSNLNPREEILAKTRIGFHEIIETADDIESIILNEEYPYLFTTYDSDKIIPELIIEDKILKYEHTNRIWSMPNIEELEDNCINYAYKKIMGETNGAKPSYCA